MTQKQYDEREIAPGCSWRSLWRRAPARERAEARAVGEARRGPARRLFVLYWLVAAVAGFSDSELFAQQWSVTNLGRLFDGARYTVPSDINAIGEIAGGSGGYENGQYMEAYIWSRERMRAVAAPPGTDYATVEATNARGDVAGSAAIGTDDILPFVWTGDSVTPLGRLGTGRLAISLGINNAGFVVGASETTSSGSTVHAFFWNGALVDLGTFTGHFTENSGAEDINDSGVIVGSSGFYRLHGSDASRACLWRNGQIEDLGHAPGHAWSRAMAINNLGQVVGDSTPDGAGISGKQAVLWSGGQVSLLGPLVPDDPGGYRFTCEARDINDFGEVVGYGETGFQTGAGFLWRNGQRTLIPDLLPPGFEWNLGPVAINNAGQMACYGFRQGDPNAQGFVMTPPVCRGFVKADANCDGRIDNFDIDPFVMALADADLYATLYAGCNWLCNLDINRDGLVNNFDIDPFVVCLVNGGCPAQP